MMNVEVRRAGQNLVAVFRQSAGIEEPVNPPLWFVDNNLSALPKQMDQERLIRDAERIWPYVSWAPEELTDRNRAAWYTAVVRQRSTAVGWVLDRGTASPGWGSGALVPRAKHYTH